MKLKELYEKVCTTDWRWRHAMAGGVRKVTWRPDASPLAGLVAELIAENGFLRQQMIVLQRLVKRPKFRSRDPRVRVVLARLNTRWRSGLLLVQPRTGRWHRRTASSLGPTRWINASKSRPPAVHLGIAADAA